MEEKKKPKASPIEQWERFGTPCYYVRFHQGIPIHVDAEPVSEFKLATSPLNANSRKYIVESMVYTEHGIIWRSRGELNVCPLANVMYARAVTQLTG